jgi:hypothetical protein
MKMTILLMKSDLMRHGQNEMMVMIMMMMMTIMMMVDD